MSELERVLRAGEEVLWSGKPEKFKTLDATYKPVFFSKVLLCAVICVVLEVIYALLATRSGAGIKMGLVLVIIACCALSPILFFTRTRTLRRCVYAATNLRLIIVADQVREIEYRRIPVCSFRKDADGHTSLLCGAKAIAAKPGKWRDIALFGNAGDDGSSQCEKFAFYAVDKPLALREALTGKVPIEGDN